MTPALIFLGVGDAATVVTADLTAAAVYKTAGHRAQARGFAEHAAGGLARRRLGADGAARAVPGVVVHRPGGLDSTLKLCIGFALLFAAATYALRLYLTWYAERAGGPREGTRTRTSARCRPS